MIWEHQSDAELSPDAFSGLMGFGNPSGMHVTIISMLELFSSVFFSVFRDLFFIFDPAAGPKDNYENYQQNSPKYEKQLGTYNS